MLDTSSVSGIMCPPETVQRGMGSIMDYIGSAYISLDQLPVSRGPAGYCYTPRKTTGLEREEMNGKVSQHHQFPLS